MVKKQSTETEDGKLTVEDRLDIIIEHLRRMDKRDRLRMIGGFFKSIIALIPVLVMIASIWYVYVHGDELLQKITQQAAQQAASFTQGSAGKLMEQFKMFPGGR